MNAKASVLVAMIIICLGSVLTNVQAQGVAHSVLATGDWWRASIETDGVYKLTGNDLVGMAGCNTSNIVVCGNIGGILNTTNGQPRPDDIEEMAIEIVDIDGDGQFDSEDYILFYATGPDRWSYDGESLGFVRTRHPYASANYVYISHNSGTHKRITSNEPSTTTSGEISKAYHLQFHEIDRVNTHKSGQIWVGERFSSSNREQTISFALPSQRSDIATINYALASTESASSVFRLTASGTTKTHTLGGSSMYGTYSMELQADNRSSIDVNIQYTAGASMATGYLDYIEIIALVPMRAGNGIATYNTLPGNGEGHLYHVSGASSATKAWDVTDYNDVRQMATTLNNGSLSFASSDDKARRFVFFDPSGTKTPSVARLANQDIHGSKLPDMVIVTNAALRSQAERLASIHSINDNMEVLVVTQDQVFNEFSSGQKDPIAIREMLRMFRQRAINEGATPVSHLLLFGKGTYDNKNILGDNLPTVVTYQTNYSFDDDGTSITTDDIFTYLDDQEGLTAGSSMDVAVGRLPAKSLEEAKHLVDKIEHYITKSDLMQSGTRGDWRNSVALLADDADPSCAGDTSFTVSSEYVARNISALHPQLTIDKIYADAYVQQSGADGSFYPDVNNAVKKRIDYGCLLLNYIGHGSAQYIGTERFIMKSDISNYQNIDRLPYFITSTCTFGRHDDPSETCGAEEFILAEGGGIACLAATRPISHVQAVNNDMIMFALDKSNTIGEAVQKAKNQRYTTQALALFGDPAIRLSIPSCQAVVTSINGRETDSSTFDTALVLSTVTVEGEIRNSDGTLVDDFEGDIFPEVYDRPKEAHTLANDNEGCEVSFLQQNSLLYKGRTTVKNGRFSFQFRVPRDVQYHFDLSRITLYAKSATEDAGGAYTKLMLGGYDETVDLHEVHPDIRLFLGDTNFRNGGITDANPTLIVLLHDSIGINAVGSGLGHDITAVLDGNNNNTITLNDLYETSFDDELCGSIHYNLTNLTKGRHTIRVKAWNIFNYSSSRELVFYVHGDDSTKTSFEAYPTPATSHVRLTMEHNLKGSAKSAMLYIYDMQGRLVRSFTPQTSNESYMVGPVDWDLTTTSGRRVSPGIYIAHFELTTDEGEKIREQGKVVVR